MRAIEDEFFAILIEDHETVEPQCAPQQFDWCLRLFDNSQERVGIGDRERAGFAAAAEFLEQRLQLLREVVRTRQLMRDFALRVVRQDVTRVAFALENYALEGVLSEVDADNRIASLCHGGNPAVAESVPENRTARKKSSYAAAARL